MAMATAAATPSFLSPQLPKSPAPPLRASHRPGSPPPLRLGLLPRRRRPATTPSAHATSLSSARGDPRDAEAAVAELLRDHGASPADAAAIAARAPGYAAMLAEGVRELELWRPGVLGRGPPRAHPQGEKLEQLVP